MIRATIALVLGSLLVLSCGKSAEERGREDMQKSQKPPEEVEPAKPVQMGSNEMAGSAAMKAPEPPAPEPTTPEEIDKARKQAMIDGRDKDVIKYCEMAKVDPAKTDPQVLLGCALAACRLHDPEKAKPWAAPLPKPLKEQAIKVCMANAVTL